MDSKEKIFKAVLRCLRAVLRVAGSQRAVLAAAHLAEELVPRVVLPTGSGPIAFFCPGKIAAWRACHLFTSEPETIAWIDTFQATDTFWDIGANVGTYSLYAAMRGNRVMAFEPAAGNYYILNRNIEINQLDDRITAFCVALHDRTGTDSFFMSHTELGAALNTFGEAVDWRGRPCASRFRQAMLGFRLDDFIDRFDPPFPHHIKIDVDGHEDRVIAGARRTVGDPRVKSMVVELNEQRPEQCERIVSELEGAGLKFRCRRGRDAHIKNYLFQRR